MAYFKIRLSKQQLELLRTILLNEKRSSLALVHTIDMSTPAYKAMVHYMRLVADLVEDFDNWTEECDENDT